MFSVDPEEYYYSGETEASPYELAMEQKRMDRLLQQQVNRYGDDAMRVNPKISVDNSTIPTEDFARSYVLRMPGVNHSVPEKKDPMKSLLKAMKIQSTGTKKNRAHVKENKVEDGRIPDKANGRPKGSYSARESSEDLTLLAR